MVSGMGLGAPGVGPEADWIPPTLVSEAFTLLPLGFALTIWGSAWGLRLAAACAVISALIGVVASSMLTASGGVLDFVMTLVPGAILAGTTAYVARRASIAPSLGRGEEATRSERPSRSAGL